MAKQPPPLDLKVRVPVREVEELLRKAENDWVPATKLIAMKFLKEEALRDVQSKWPVLTGRSRAGMYTVIEGWNIVFRNKWNYAYWVEKKHFNILPFLRRKWPTLLTRLKFHLQYR